MGGEDLVGLSGILPASTRRQAVLDASTAVPDTRRRRSWVLLVSLRATLCPVLRSVDWQLVWVMQQCAMMDALLRG